MRILRTGCVAILLTLATWRVTQAQPAEARAVLEQALQTFDQAQALIGTDHDRARQLFLSAARSLEELGIANGRLEYNIGNCYLQAGRVGRAILHYRRAERLLPGDPLIADNLRLARSRRLTSIDPRPGSSLLRGVFFLHYSLSYGARVRLALGFFLAIWLLLALRLVVRSRAISTAAVIAAAVAFTLTGSAMITRWSDRNTPAGVVLAMDVVAYKGPGETYQRQFEQPLQPGVEFTLRERRGPWWKIELPDGKMGWIEAEAAELVPYAVASGSQVG